MCIAPKLCLAAFILNWVLIQAYGDFFKQTKPPYKISFKVGFYGDFLIQLKPHGSTNNEFLVTSGTRTSALQVETTLNIKGEASVKLIDSADKAGASILKAEANRSGGRFEYFPVVKFTYFDDMANMNKSAYCGAKISQNLLIAGGIAGNLRS